MPCGCGGAAGELPFWVDRVDPEWTCGMGRAMACGANETATCTGAGRRCTLTPTVNASIALPTYALGMLRQRACFGAVERWEREKRVSFGWVAFLRFDAGFFAPLPPLSAFAAQGDGVYLGSNRKL